MSGDAYAGFSEAEIERDIIDENQSNDLHSPTQSYSARVPLVGNIQSNGQNAISQSYLNSSIPGEDRRAPTNTIDEAVWATLSRDLRAVWEKLRQVLWPQYILGGYFQRRDSVGMAERSSFAGRLPDAEAVLQGGMSEGLRDWDLWGPLIFCLLLSLLLSAPKSSDERSIVFSGVFAMVWTGEAAVTMQIKLLGGNISFFQSVCIIGYTLFPLVIAALLSAVHVPVLVRIPTYILLVIWALAAGVSILGGSGVVKNRVGIAVYPLFVFYVGLGTICFIS